MPRGYARLAFLSLTLTAVLRVSASETWWPANDTAKIQRSGDWQWTSHRYAAESALATQQDGAALEFSFRGHALVLCLDTLTPPNNYGPPELGALEISVDDAKLPTIRPRSAANEVTLLRTADDRSHRVRVEHRLERGGAGARIRGFRIATEPTGDLAWIVSGEQNGALLDVRAVFSRQGTVIRGALVRNRLTGECRLAALPPGEGYSLELRASGWTTFRADGISIKAGEETAMPPVYLTRMRNVPQDAFPFPASASPFIRKPGESFRARFEGQRADIRAVRLVRQLGPATISRRCQFVEDKSAAFYYHREGIVTVPPDTPPGMYDLEVTLFEDGAAHTLVTSRSVNVVTAYSPDPVFVSWGHLDTWGQYQAEYVERLATIANLLAADMVLVSTEGNPAYAAGALHALEMPFVINFGNHRGPDPGPWFGRPVGVVDFGTAFSVLNFGYAWDQNIAEADQLLATRSTSRIKIINAFESNAPVREFLDRHAVALIHYAHGPGPVVASLGATPTVRVGKSNSESFRVIRFRDGRPASFTYRGHATAPIPFPRAARAPLGIAYEPANDGTQHTSTARFHNDLEEPFPNCRAVFVLPRGIYRVSQGRIEQAVESDDTKFTVLSVRFDLPARSAGSIEVSVAR